MAMNTFGSDKQILYSGCLLDANYCQGIENFKSLKHLRHFV